jgi:hypothetical protein
VYDEIIQGKFVFGKGKGGNLEGLRVCTGINMAKGLPTGVLSISHSKVGFRGVHFCCEMRQFILT